MYTQVVHLVLQFKSQTKYRLRRHNSTIKQPHKNFQTIARPDQKDFFSSLQIKSILDTVSVDIL